MPRLCCGSRSDSRKYSDDHRTVRYGQHAIRRERTHRQSRNAGFLIVDPDVLSGKLSISQIYRKGDVPDGVAKKIGSLSGAEVVIYGRAVVQVSNLSVLKSKVARASANVRAVNVQTGQIIAMSSLNHQRRHLRLTMMLWDRFC